MFTLIIIRNFKTIGAIETPSDKGVELSNKSKLDLSTKTNGEDKDKVTFQNEVNKSEKKVITKDTPDGKKVETFSNDKLIVCEAYDSSGSLTCKKDVAYENKDGKEYKTATTIFYKNGEKERRSIESYINDKIQSSEVFNANNQIKLKQAYNYKPNNEMEVKAQFYENEKIVIESIEKFKDGKLYSRKSDNLFGGCTLEENHSYESRDSKEITKVSGIIKITGIKGSNICKSKYIEEHENGRIVFREQYDLDNKLSDRMVYSYPDEKDHTTYTATSTKYDDEGEISMTRTITSNKGQLNREDIYNSKGNLVLTTIFESSVDGGVSKAIAYRPDGTISQIEDRISKEDIYCDKEGKPLYKCKADDFRKENKQMISLDSRTVLDFKSLSTDELKNEINSPERFFLFESLVSEDHIRIPKDKFSEVRKHGLGKCDEVMKTLENFNQKYDVKIIPLLPRELGNHKFTSLSYEKLLDSLNGLEREIQKYPPGFFKGRDLRIFLCSEIRDTKKSCKLSTVGGLQCGHSIFLAEVTNSFDHEVYHFLEDTNGGYNANNTKWEKQYAGKYPGNKGYEWFDNLEKDPTLQLGLDSAYAMTKDDEHQAVFAERLFQPGEDNYMAGLKYHAEHREKMAVHRKQIIEEYKKWSGGLMDEQYFNDIRDEKISDWDAYWANKAFMIASTPKNKSAKVSNILSKPLKK